MNKYNSFIVHIPHSSVIIPEEFILDKDYNYREIMEEIIFEADYMIDLFSPLESNNIVKFSYSRMFCDVERYKDDKKEEMVLYGMGVIYQKDVNGRIIRNDNNEYKKYIIDNYYNKHHNKLNRLAIKLLDKLKCCYIIDLHSFSDSYVYKIFGKINNPDICIGYDKAYIDKELLVKTYELFKSYGYSVKYNYPYKGSIVPNIKDKDKVCSIMIEINKRIYLDYNLVLNIDKYIKLKECMNKYYKYLSEYINSRL